ncbi:glycosyltransferase-like protein, family 2 [Leptospira yanagawae serovar Saopaulo str. Sao Paulo = ATCC 700523]|uniref:Glycosyltransferase-like protein, family 2 n=1 Tax=Leptospira yanagawae serovar Saopaulo str. Sao Paulo = ATCC 700523 TaxID=1249483 RepID=A0A5E8HB93_9LEPT|nr:glycosyltransferase family 2 protein [Leptospira yanagawae]EOQ88037.1 glycosyltransferase-like protein, family 2 [Leptospira yanagawae serovar Saopaulo str. Sao Paulo = ATCC 700523]
MRLVSSIVLYKNPKEVMQKAIDSFLEGKDDRRVILVDHSPTNELASLAGKQVTYFHNPDNPGFGAGHNFAFANSPESDYFIIQNPDVFLDPGSMELLLEKLNQDQNIGIITGKILNSDRTLQKLLKKDPNILALLARRFTSLSNLSIFKKALNNFEFDDMFYEKENTVPVISGCFMVIPSTVYREIKGFDERFFLYFEDFDLCRKIREVGKKVYYFPNASIVHLWKRGAHSSFKHLFYFTRSMFQYFRKWGGWF